MKVRCPTCHKVRNILTEAEKINKIARAKIRAADRVEDRVRAGLCASCHRPRVSNNYCQLCLDKRAKANKARRARYKAMGICIDCKSPVVGAYSRCQQCRDKNADRLNPHLRAIRIARMEEIE